MNSEMLNRRVQTQSGRHVFLRGVFVLWLLLVLPVAAVDIIAHRGASHDAPENTEAAARLGWRQGADGVEIDVHLSHDGRAVVLHDVDTKRTTGVPGKVADQNWRALHALDAGAWKDARWRGERIPLLEEIIKTVPDKKRLFIEIKCGPEILPELERVLRRSRLRPAQTVLIGFGYETMVQARQRFPEVTVHWLSSFQRQGDSGAFTPTVDDLIRRAKAGKFTGLSVNYRGPVDAAFVGAVKAAGLQCHVWTVDDPEAARRLRSAGVDSITTNRPEWLREQLGYFHSP
jgi:glycerophosphoryl diester phosphodiesterase